jgi:predicted DNA-binding transcriptional regulator AlpA
VIPDPILGAVSIPDRRVHEGRTVVTRDDVMRRAGVRPATAQNWYRDRAHNGHPRPVVAVGRRLYFDEEALQAWVEAQTDPAPPPPRIVRDGRSLVVRAEIGRLTGLSEAAVADLYVHRAISGHPEAVYRDRRHVYFDERETLGWYAARTVARTVIARKRRGHR